MLYTTTLKEIENNTNPGVEYEIALFYKLLYIKQDEAKMVLDAIKKRLDCNSVMRIIRLTDASIIKRSLEQKRLTLVDSIFETQNDKVGPADIVLVVKEESGNEYKLGLSVKYSNRNTLNPTARRFLTDNQIAKLQGLYDEKYIPQFIEEMKVKYGNVRNWKRKRSRVADSFYDEVRDAVIENWPNIKDKTSLLSRMFHSDSPIPFWVVNYSNKGYSLETVPETVDEKRANDIVPEKYCDAFVAFKLDGRIIGKVQVKCNNGFIEDQFNHAGKAKKKEPDFIIDGEPRIKGKPFRSWDFTLGK